MKEITSRDNQWVRMAHSLKKKKGRQEQSRFLAEGYRLLADAIRVGIMDGICFVTEKGMHHEGFDAFLAEGETLGWTFFRVTDSVYDKIKDTGNPQGMAAMLPLFPYTLQALDTLESDRPVLYLEDIQDPGNLGTILRTAAATNGPAVLLSEGSVDVYNDKAIRSAMGAIFKVPVIQHVTLDDLLAFRRRSGRFLLGTAPLGKVRYTDAPYEKPVILAFGNEGNGLSRTLQEQCDALITIPMKPDTESLNLSLSAGIILYKAWEINGFKE